MDWLWTWGGKSFGFRDGEDLWTHDGRQVGRFRGEEVFAPDGRYLGELRKGKLITRISSKNRRGPVFAPHANRVGRVDRVGHVGSVMIAGYEDFPGPDEL